MFLKALVVDANIVVAALLKDSTSRRFLLRAKKPQLFTPEFINQELSKYTGDFSKRLKVEEDELKVTLGNLILASEMKIVSMQEYLDFMDKAMEITPDVKDMAYFALALKLECPLWSQDRRLKQQSLVRVLDTREVLKDFE